MIYIARHGQTDWNLEHRLQGHTDIPLNEKGKNEAVLCSNQLTSVKLDKIISSDLSRAKETAHIINSSLSLPIEYDFRLREIHFGDLQGVKKENISDESWHSFKYDPAKIHAESFAHLYKRVRSFFDDIDAQTNTLVITHSYVIRMITYLSHHPHSFDNTEFEKTALQIKTKNTEIFKWDKLHPLQPLNEAFTSEK